MKITFGKIERIIILGGSWMTAALLRQLAGREVEVLLYTSPRHHNEVVDDDGNTLKQVADLAGVSSVVSKDINNDKSIENAVTTKTLGLAMGAAWMFEPKTVELFKGRLLDFMGISFPQYCGGAHYTWQILASNKTGACNLQIIHGGEHTFHKGEIMKRRDYLFPASARKSKDYFSAAIKEELDFSISFLMKFLKANNFQQRLSTSRSPATIHFLTRSSMDGLTGAGMLVSWIGSFAHSMIPTQEHQPT
jgi:hypothetical protein